MIATAGSGGRAKRSRLSTLGLGVNPIRQPTSSRPDPVPVTVGDSSPGPSLLLNTEADIDFEALLEENGITVDVEASVNCSTKHAFSAISQHVLPQPEVLPEILTQEPALLSIPVERAVPSSTRTRISMLEDMEGKLESAVLTMGTMLNRVRAMKAEILHCIGTQPKEMSSTGTMIFEDMTNPSISYNKGILLISSTDGTVRVQP